MQRDESIFAPLEIFLGPLQAPVEVLRERILRRGVDRRLQIDHQVGSRRVQREVMIYLFVQREFVAV